MVGGWWDTAGTWWDDGATLVDVVGRGGTLVGRGGTWWDAGGTWWDGGGTVVGHWWDVVVHGGTLVGHWWDVVGHWWDMVVLMGQWWDVDGSLVRGGSGEGHMWGTGGTTSWHATRPGVLPSLRRGKGTAVPRTNRIRTDACMNLSRRSRSVNGISSLSRTSSRRQPYS